ncbi:MAG: TetR/AcrR family transcriptional regulator [Solirubrobacterales bacterium]|nr:TetR/AcrR family transcriptional regulator [Solirubrobacterales bacterium]
MTSPETRRLPSGRHNLPREFVINSQRDRLLDSMAEACSEKRYAEVSVADVVARARVSRSTFYEIFPDKEACFLAAYDAILGRFVSEVIRACSDRGLTWTEQVEIGIETSLNFLAAEPAFARMCIVDMFSAGQSALDRYLSALRLISGFIDTGRQRMPGNEDVPPSVAGMVVGGAAVVIRGEIVDERTELLPAVGPDLLYGILAHYVDQDEALAQAESYASRIGPPPAQAGLTAP